MLAGPRGTSKCQTTVDIFESTCQDLGVPIAHEKSVGPTTELVFLGFVLNTNDMSVRIPSHKVSELQTLIQQFLGKKKVSLREMQKLTGKLNFFGQAVRSSRAFIRRFYDAMIPLKKPGHMLRVTKEIREDLLVWLQFLQLFNGVTYIPEQRWFTNESLGLFTDAAGAADLGAACYLAGHWCFFPWPASWACSAVLRDMSFLEMVPVLLAIWVWSGLLQNKKVKFFIDNEALVAILNKQTSRSKRLMQLVRPFVLACMSDNITFKAIHIGSKQNSVADAISRRQWERFRRE